VSVLVASTSKTFGPLVESTVQVKEGRDVSAPSVILKSTGATMADSRWLLLRILSLLTVCTM
jgi:hypothetical protein